MGSLQDPIHFGRLCTIIIAVGADLCEIAPISPIVIDYKLIYIVV